MSYYFQMKRRKQMAQVNLEIVSVCALEAVSCAAEKDSVFLRKNPVETLDDSHFI